MEKSERIEKVLRETARELDKALDEIRSADIGDDDRAAVEDEVCGEFQGWAARFLARTVAGKLRARERSAPAEQEYFLRFPLFFRIQHMIMFTSVIFLILTGLPLKFPDSFMAGFIFASSESFMVAKVVHRVAAGGLALFVVLHLYYAAFTKIGRRDLFLLLPRPKDARDLIDNMKYFLGLSRRHARFDRFSYIEKFDYWAVYWGVIVMIGTGLGLWFQEQFMAIMPKYMLDALKEMHSDEALLATLAIVIWHFYNVHLNPSRFPGTLLWWHGKISAGEMKHEHPLEYERIMKERMERETKTSSVL